MNYFLVGIGGIAGSIVRYMLGKYISARTGSVFPLGTMIVNITGALLLGIVSISVSREWYYLLGDGFLGAYTTFSTFMYEGISLFENNEMYNALIYIICSFVVGLVGFGIGMKIGNMLFF